MTRRIAARVAAVAALALGLSAVAAARSDGGSAAPLEALVSHSTHHEGLDSTHVAQLLATLRASDPLVCELLVDRIGNYWDSGDDGIGRLADARALQAAKDSVRGRISSRGAQALLLATMSDDDPCVRQLAGEWLGRSAIPTDQLIQRLTDPSQRVREVAAFALGVGHREHGVASRRALERLAGDGEAHLQAMAVWALGEAEDTASLPALRRALQSTTEAVQLAAIVAIAEFDDAPSRSRFETLLRTSRSDAVRARAAEALGELGDVQSLDVLAKALGDATGRVRHAAVQAIEQLEGLEEAPPALIAATTQSADTTLQRMAAITLAELHDQKTLDALLALVSHPDREVRLHIAEALGEVGTTKANAGLLRLLSDADAEVRRAAAEALGEARH